MAKTATVRARIEPEVKRKAEKVLKALGVSTSDVISMLMHHVALNRSVPFDLRIPNAETREAMREALEGRNMDPPLQLDHWSDFVRKL